MNKSTEQIRKELAILIKKKQQYCSSEAERNKAVNNARCEINKKYGKRWREKDAHLKSYNDNQMNEHVDHVFGEHWMD